MAFGDPIRFAAAPSTVPMGIGGDSSVIWHCDTTEEEVYELKTSDLSVSRSAATPSTGGQGIGGDSSTIWHCDTTDKLYELKTSDLSESRGANSPGAQARGIGGDSSTIWHCDDTEDDVYELKTSDLSVSRSANAPYIQPNGIGGDSSTIWNCHVKVPGLLYELKTSDLSVSRSANLTIGSYPYGVGGDSTTIWNCGYVTERIYELDETAVVAPTVTTQAASDVEATTATGNGNITSIGGENCDIRGIVWDLASHGDPGGAAPGASGYANDIHSHGSYGTGAFTESLTSLPPEDTIYARAYAHNSAGYNYGSEINFLTLSLGWSGKISGVTDPAKIMGVEVANIAKVKGVVSA